MAAQNPTTSTSIEVVSVGEIKAVVDQLHELGIDPLHLHIDGHRPTDPRPNVKLHFRYRRDFTKWADSVGLTKRIEERHGWGPGQRRFAIDHDNEHRRLLAEVVSFDHHPDWEPRHPEARR